MKLNPLILFFHLLCPTMLVAFISYDHPQVMKVLPWSCAVKVVLCVPLKKWLSLLRFAWELDRIEQDNHCHCKSLALALGSWTLISMNLDDWMFKTLSARWVWMTWAISMRRSKCLKSFAKNVEFWAERITSSCNTTWSIVWSPVATFEWRYVSANLESWSLPFVVSLQMAVYVAIVHVTASRCAGPTEFVKLCEGALQAAGCVGRLWKAQGWAVTIRLTGLVQGVFPGGGRCTIEGGKIQKNDQKVWHGSRLTGLNTKADQICGSNLVP